MAFTGQTQVNISIAGVSLAGSLSLTASGQIAQDVSLPAGIAGTLSTVTDTDTGTLTLPSGHGLLDNDLVDLYWVGGSRYGTKVSSSGATSVVIGAVTVGAGDNLPAQGTAIVVCKQTVVDMDFNGDLVKMYGASCDQRSTINFLTVAPASIHHFDLPAHQPDFWYYGSGFTNPFASNTCASLTLSNGSIVAATLRLLLLYASS